MLEGPEVQLVLAPTLLLQDAVHPLAEGPVPTVGAGLGNERLTSREAQHDVQ